MPVYVDPLMDFGWKYGQSCHMIADNNEELHAMADRIGLKRSWFQTARDPHYDLTASKRALAVRYGAIELDHRPFHEILRQWREIVVARLSAATSEEEREAIRADLYR